MKPALTFQTEVFTGSSLGTAASIPDLLPKTKTPGMALSFPDTDNEIRAGYGKITAAYPYRPYACYSRTLEKKEMSCAILENDFLKAVFLPGLGGRLWSLTDKTTGENLLYTNDVLRPSNLAVRNAWISGGVEWNIGLIGHSPFTMEQLFTAKLEDDAGLPVLRMYEYERIRKTAFQMDFWLEEHSPFLNCRMRIFNQTSQTVPMYWWSNMAVPEYEGGRVISPAKEVFTNHGSCICKVLLPLADGTDISRYKDIPRQADYFFNIPENSPKYIANIGKNGYGLLHLSTNSLKGRKLFSWGNSEASDNWQNFLTEKAGRYVEIQAGLGKTQYGCIPMPPHTTWEWVEMYGPVQASPQLFAASFEQAAMEISSIAERHLKRMKPEQMLSATKPLADKKGVLLCRGSGYGALENEIRSFNNEPLLPGHLDFSNLSEDDKRLCRFLETGIFPDYPVTETPPDFIADDTLCKRLTETIETLNKGNWYAHYQLGLSHLAKNELKQAETQLLASNTRKENPWALHALAVLKYRCGNEKQAASCIVSGCSYRKKDLSYVKETWRLLLLCHSYEALTALYGSLPGQFQKDSRILFGYLQALAHTGHEKKVLDYLDSHSFVLDDLRECEESLGELWHFVHKKVYGENGRLPRRYNFNSV